MEVHRWIFEPRAGDCLRAAFSKRDVQSLRLEAAFEEIIQAGALRMIRHRRLDFECER